MAVLAKADTAARIDLGRRTGADATIANSAVTAISGTGEISLLTSASAQVIVDVFGYWR